MGFNIQKMLPVIVLAAETASIVSKVMSTKATVTIEEVDSLVNSITSTLNNESKSISQSIVNYSDARACQSAGATKNKNKSVDDVNQYGANNTCINDSSNIKNEVSSEGGLL